MQTLPFMSCAWTWIKGKIKQTRLNVMLMQRSCWANGLVFFMFAARHCCLLLTSRFRSCATLNSIKCASQFVETQTDTAIPCFLSSLRIVILFFSR